MSSALCIDFGTSSIRAVYRDTHNERHVLPIGLVTGAKSIDEASIRSEIHIDAKGKKIRFGEHAFMARSKLASTNFYEASPKLWLLKPHDLDSPAFSGLSVSKRQLLTGLLAYGIFGAKEALSHLNIQLPKGDLDIRIAHPVWSNGLAKRANQELLSIGFAASKMADEGDWGEVPVSTLKSYFEPPLYVDSLDPKSDVVEPIAAAIEMLIRKVNVRQICAVVDVGAGTTDIGLFFSVVTQGRPDRLIPISSTRSIFKAGNEIDRVLFEELSERSAIKDELRLYDVRTRIRQVKEFLFKNGFVQELGVRITLDDFEALPDIKKMAREIRSCFSDSVQAHAKKIFDWTRDPNVVIVMAGGGGSVRFIRSALSSSLKIGQSIIPLRINDSEKIELLTYGASRERLAVALGGANVHYDGLKYELDKLEAIPSLGFAKQDVTKVRPIDEVFQVSTPSSSSTLATPSVSILEANKAKEEKAIWREQISKLAKIADKGDVDAQYEIAEKLSNASSQYLKEAMDWYVRASRQGNQDAQLKLVKLLLSGKAIAENHADAYFWSLVVAQNGSSGAVDDCNKIRLSLSTVEAERIQIAAKSWRPKSENVITVPVSKVIQRPSSTPIPDSRFNSPANAKVIPNKTSGSIAVNPFDELKIRELVRHSSFLKSNAKMADDLNDVIKWSKRKDVFEAAFLAKYCCLKFDVSVHLNDENRTKLKAWLDFSKRRGL